MELYWSPEPELMVEVTDQKDVDKAQCYYHALDVEKLKAELTALRERVKELVAESDRQTEEMASFRTEVLPKVNAEWSEKLRKSLAEAESLRNRYSTECPVCGGSGTIPDEHIDEHGEVYKMGCPNPNCINGRVMMRSADEVKARVDLCRRAKSPNAYQGTAHTLLWVLSPSTKDNEEGKR